MTNITFQNVEAAKLQYTMANTQLGFLNESKATRTQTIKENINPEVVANAKAALVDVEAAIEMNEQIKEAASNFILANI